MVVSSTSCSYRTYVCSSATRGGALLVSTFCYCHYVGRDMSLRIQRLRRSQEMGKVRFYRVWRRVQGGMEILFLCATRTAKRIARIWSLCKITCPIFSLSTYKIPK